MESLRIITKEEAGIATRDAMSRCETARKPSQKQLLDEQNKGHSLMSQKTGAEFLTLLDHIIPLIATVRLCKATQIAKEQAPVFQVWKRFLDIDKSTSKHATRFAMGTRGNNGSMLG